MRDQAMLQDTQSYQECRGFILTLLKIKPSPGYKRPQVNCAILQWKVTMLWYIVFMAIKMPQSS